MSGEVSISLFWLLNNHPEILDEWNAYMKPKKEQAAKTMKKRVKAVQKWLDEKGSELEDNWRLIIQASLNAFNDSITEQDRKSIWNNMIDSLQYHPDFPKIRASALNDKGDGEE